VLWRRSTSLRQYVKRKAVEKEMEMQVMGPLVRDVSAIARSGPVPSRNSAPMAIPDQEGVLVVEYRVKGRPP
jgi:hypothetical protein